MFFLVFLVWWSPARRFSGAEIARVYLAKTWCTRVILHRFLHRSCRRAHLGLLPLLFASSLGFGICWPGCHRSAGSAQHAEVEFWHVTKPQRHMPVKDWSFCWVQFGTTETFAEVKPFLPPCHHPLAPRLQWWALPHWEHLHNPSRLRPETARETVARVQAEGCSRYLSCSVSDTGNENSWSHVATCRISQHRPNSNCRKDQVPTRIGALKGPSSSIGLHCLSSVESVRFSTVCGLFFGYLFRSV